MFFVGAAAFMKVSVSGKYDKLEQYEMKNYLCVNCAGMRHMIWSAYSRISTEYENIWTMTRIFFTNHYMHGNILTRSSIFQPLTFSARWSLTRSKTVAKCKILSRHSIPVYVINTYKYGQNIRFPDAHIHFSWVVKLPAR